MHQAKFLSVKSTAYVASHKVDEGVRSRARLWVTPICGKGTSRSSNGGKLEMVSVYDHVPQRHSAHVILPIIVWIGHTHFQGSRAR